MNFSTNISGSNLAPSQGATYDDAPRGAMRVLNSMSTQAAFRAKGLKSSEDTGERKPKPKPAPSASTLTSKTSTSAGGSSKAGSGSSAEKPIKAKPAKDMQNPSSTPAPASASAKGGKASIPSIMPHESLGEYNRRVESIMRAGVSQAIKSANKTKAEQEKQARLAKEERRRLAQTGGKAGTDSKADTAPASGKRKHDVSDAALEFAEKSGPRRLNDIAQAPPSLPTLRVARDDNQKSVWTAKGKERLGLSVGQERIMEEERERVIKQYREIKAKKEGAREAERAKEEEARNAKGKGAKKRKIQKEDDEQMGGAVAGAIYDSD